MGGERRIKLSLGWFTLKPPLELTDRFSQRAAELWEPSRAEQQQNDDHYYQKLRQAY